MDKPKGATSKGKRKRDDDPSVPGTSKRTKNNDIQDDEDGDDMDLSKASVPELLLANSWKVDGGQDITGWWMSEKLDGVRQVVLFQTPPYS